jgi:5'-3' exonuclease
MAQHLTLLVDASSLLYRAFFSTPDSVRSPDGKPINAAHGFLNMLARLVNDHDPSRLACAVDEDWRPAWRVELVPEYKAARVAGVATAEQTAADDDVGRQSVYVFKLLEGLGVPVVGLDACEAEDIIGTLAEREAARPDTRVAIVSGDRDLYQLVRDPEVYVLYPVKGVSEMLRVDEAEVTRRYKIPGRSYADFAVLRGDPSDGLPGVKGIGEKTAASLLNTHGKPRRDRQGGPGEPRRRSPFPGRRPPRLRGTGPPGRGHPPGPPAPGPRPHPPPHPAHPRSEGLGRRPEPRRRPRPTGDRPAGLRQLTAPSPR